MDIGGKTTTILEVSADTRSVPAATQALEKFDVAQQKVAKSSISMQREAENIIRRLDPMARATAQAERDTDRLNKAFSQGVISSEQHSRALGLISSKVEEVRIRTGQATSTVMGHSAAINDNAKALHAHSSATSLNRMQMMESMHVMKTFVDETIATGQPLRALALEGGRIAQIFASGSGGVGGTLRAMGNQLAGLATGWVGISAAVVAAGAAGVAASLQWASAQDRLATSLNGVGRASGLSVSGLDAIATKGAASLHLTSGEGRDLASQFAGAGINGGMIPGMMGTAQRYSKTMGVDLGEAGKLLADAFKDPAKGADELNQKLGFLDGKTREFIRTLSEQGDKLGAQKALFDAVSKDVQSMTDRTWHLKEGWEAALSKASEYWDRAGKAGASVFMEPPLHQQRANLQSMLDNKPLGVQMFGSNAAWEATQAELKRKIAEIDEKLRAGEVEDASKKADQLLNERSRNATDLVRGALPEQTAARELGNKIESLTKALEDPAVAARMGAGGPEALSRLRVASANSDPMLRLAQDSKLAIDAINAESVADRALVEARRAELSILRESSDVVRASASAEAARRLEIEKANKVVKDAADQSERDSKYARMTPYQRGLSEINDKWSDLSDKNGTSRSSLAEIFSKASTSSGVPASILMAIGKQESNFTNPENGQGIMQILSSTAKRPGYGLSPMDPAMRNDPAANIGFGASYFAARARSSGLTDWNDPAQLARALAAYNGGGDPHYAAHVMRYLPSNGNNDDITRGKSAAVSAYNFNTIEKPINEANRALDEQKAALELQKAAAGQSAEQLGYMTEKQKLLNEALRQGVGDNPTVLSGIEKIARGYGDLAKAQDEFTKSVASNDNLRSGGRDFLGTFVNDLVAGKGAAKSFGDAMEQLGKKILGAGLDKITDIIFGKQGSPLGGGIFGGILSGLFGGTTKSAMGNVMTPDGPMPLRRYSTGGVATTPQLAMFGEGSQNEAYVPLPDGRSIPVAMKGGAGNVSIGGHTIVVQGNADNEAIAKMKAELAQANRDQMRNLERNMGQKQARWAGRYGT